MKATRPMRTWNQVSREVQREADMHNCVACRHPTTSTHYLCPCDDVHPICDACADKVDNGTLPDCAQKL